MNTSIRIKNAQGQWATVWSISEHFYSIQWDGDKTTQSITKQQLEVLKKHSVEVVITDHSVITTNKYGEKYVESGVKELPETFKFKVREDLCNDSITYTYQHSENGHNVFWDTGSIHYHIDTIKRWVDNGEWIVIPEGKKPIDTLQLKIEIDNLDEVKKFVEELAEQSNTLLESIKDFTSGTGHDVFVTEGIYKVYRNGEDVPYVCPSDEVLKKTMSALLILDSLETEF